MTQLSQFLVELTDETNKLRTVMHFCPGCGDMHPFNLEGHPDNHRWTWDGNLLEPTFGPSMLIKTGQNFEHICHSFTIKGRIQFLPDSTHTLSGFTVPVPPLPDYWQDKKD